MIIAGAGQVAFFTFRFGRGRDNSGGGVLCASRSITDKISKA